MPTSRRVCAGCGTKLAADEQRPFRCPRAGDDDDVDHVLRRELDLEGLAFPGPGEPNPFVRFRTLLHSYRCARARGLADSDFVALVQRLDAAVASVDGRGFRETPYAAGPELARELGLGELWIKDETGNVAGSHKARHLFGIALQLAVTGGEEELGIASCGNAALAAAVVARALGRTLVAFVPPSANDAILDRLDELGARIERCARERGAKASTGDPCQRALRRAVADGMLPFSVQGSQNGLALEGGSTLAWELARHHATASDGPLDLLAIQVGGGALAASSIQGLDEARALGALDRTPRIHAVQTEGGHPLERAWRRMRERAAKRRPPSLAYRRLLPSMQSPRSLRAPGRSTWCITANGLGCTRRRGCRVRRPESTRSSPSWRSSWFHS